MKIELPNTAVVPIDKITPYWRNPRRITPEAVEGVRRSLGDYGDVQPIVVDSDFVIIVGHTRHQALTQIGESETEVYIATDLSPEKVREYRLADNRLSEMTQWDHSQLMMELREWESSLVAAYFPNLDLEVDVIRAATPDVTPDDMVKAEREVKHIKDPGPTLVTAVQCPSCARQFSVRTDSMPGLNRLDLEQLAAQSVSGDDGAE